MAPPFHSATNDAQIFLVYRLFFLYVEPISALLGAYFSFFEQSTYLVLTHALSAPRQHFIPISTQIVLSQLSNLYLLFAINEALVLRSTEDLRVWKTLLFGLLIADLGHLWSVKVLGWDLYWSVGDWNAIDWGNVGFVYVGALMRSCFLLGVGVKRSKGQVTMNNNVVEKPSKEPKRRYGVSELFAGLNVSLTGFEDLYYRDELGGLIMSHGGRYRGDLYKGYSTHLIAKETVGAKYDAACKWGLEIVTVDWLLQSIEKEKILDENLFRLHTIDR